MPRIWLVGMMGSGKTSIGREVASRLGVGFFDTDTDVAARFGATVPEIFDRFGEDEFRRVEHEVIAERAAADGVVATGGGAVLRDDNVAVMRSSGTVVWLEASPEALAERVGSGLSRPLLAGDETPEGRLAGILAGRRRLYGEAADVRIDTESRARAEIVAEVAGLWTTS